MSQSTAGDITFTAKLTAPPPPPPRVLTAAGRRRAWGERPVRIVLTAALVMALVAGFLFMRDLLRWRSVVDLIQNGIAIDAEITRAGGTWVKGQGAWAHEPVTLTYTRDGAQAELRGYLDGQTGRVTVGQKISIRLDPADPRRWTSRTQPPPLLNNLIGFYVALPFLVVLWVGVLLARRGVLRLWRTGHALTAQVERVKASALAPGSQLVTCSLIGVDDRRLRTVLLPTRQAAVRPGDQLCLIVPAGTGGKAGTAGRAALPACLYL